MLNVRREGISVSASIYRVRVNRICRDAKDYDFKSAIRLASSEKFANGADVCVVGHPAWLKMERLERWTRQVVKYEFGGWRTPAGEPIGYAEVRHVDLGNHNLVRRGGMKDAQRSRWNNRCRI